MEDFELSACSRREQGPVVALINPGDAPLGGRFSASRPTYPALGLLRLGSALRQAPVPGVTVRYIDASGIPGGNEAVAAYLAENAGHLLVVACSVLTSNYPPSLDHLRLVKKLNPGIVTIVGNDHFSVFYERIMRRRQDCIDYGFCGNDVTAGFTQLVGDIAAGRPLTPARYSGLVFRDGNGQIVRNPEGPGEYATLAPIDYTLVTTFDLFQSLNYLLAQQRTFGGVLGGRPRGTTIDIARGCPKFRVNGSTGRDRRCSFCAIVPGTASMAAAPLEKAWETIRTAVDAGFNFLFVTADDLLLGFSPLVRALAESKPAWYRQLEEAGAAPQFLAYSRADAFVRCGARSIDAARALGITLFFVGFDYFDPLSLEISRKPFSQAPGAGRLMHEHHAQACRTLSRSGFRVIGGVILNHLGMTRSLLERNFTGMIDLLRAHRDPFIAIQYGPLCPIPGSRDYEYLTNPRLAESTAAAFGLKVDRARLQTLAEKYRDQDAPLLGELVEDYIAGCCPEITLGDVEEFARRLRVECGALGIACGEP